MSGSPTSTGWKRRSSAASFSMCLRYSSRVVAPTARSSPRASIGFSRLAASTAPSAAPAPTIVCSSSRKRITSPAASAISLSTALSRSSNSPRYFPPAVLRPREQRAEVERHPPLVARPVRPVAGHDALGQALDDGRLAHAGLADQHRVVLRPPREHLDDPAHLVVPADDRVELPAPGE